MRKYIGYILSIILIGILLYALKQQISEYTLQDDPMLYTLKEVLKPVHPIIDELKLYKGDKSFTINKDKIFLCLYDKNGNYYPLNMLIYVLLHEVSHRINDVDVGHTPEFHRIFNELLEKATQIGVYNPSIPVIQNYCGT